MVHQTVYLIVDFGFSLDWSILVFIMPPQLSHGTYDKFYIYINKSRFTNELHYYIAKAPIVEECM